MKMHGGFGLNFVNTYDLQWAEEYGLADTEVSFELTFERINALGGKIPRGIISYGHLPLMLCRNCPNKSAGIECSACKNSSKMKDRKGEYFYLKCDGICTEVLNCAALVVPEKETSTLLTDFNVLRFNVENYVENVENILALMQNSMLKTKITRGLYHRGVK
jgi:putative protease